MSVVSVERPARGVKEVTVLEAALRAAHDEVTVLEAALRAARSRRMTVMADLARCHVPYAAIGALVDMSRQGVQQIVAPVVGPRRPRREAVAA